MVLSIRVSPIGPEREEAIVLLSIYDKNWRKPLEREIRLVVEGENWINDIQAKDEHRGGKKKKKKGELQTTWLENG